MNELTLGPGADQFIWASGVEDTFVPQSRSGHRALDEYELIGHYENWREDLQLGRELGLNAIRWGIPWYRVEPKQGEFDWSWTDQVIPYLVQELGITPIIDLMHYGCPFWLHKEFANRDYPRAVASYAAAFARRYQSLIRWYTPLNEPLINSLMCGMRSLWPPYLRGDKGYITIMMQLVKGILRTVNVIKEIQPQAMMVHVEAAGLSRAIRHDLEVLALEDQRRGYLGFDLLTGKVTYEHPLFTWLVRNGIKPDDLAEVAGNRISLDVVGLNFYPQWSTKQIYTDQKGRLAYRNIEQEGTGFSNLIEDYYHRYQAPVIITETSAFGDHQTRSHWLEASLLAIKHLRERGIPVHGYTWFPMFTMTDWRYRFASGPVEQFDLQLGFYELQRQGTTRWLPTPLVAEWQNAVRKSTETIGTLRQSAAQSIHEFNI